ncbi:S41 family peptidase [Ureibacillus sp. FSL K6-8385]|uniref:lmo1851 family serine protease n=1 Tax=Ureibacillus sp. FSL K6-8385 TaxID=2954684 RepID=UPI0031584084
MRVVKIMEEQNQQEKETQQQQNQQGKATQQQEQNRPAARYIRLKPFNFIMLMVLTIIFTSGLTIFALTFGDKKVVEVTADREEFSQLYDAFDELKEKYYKEVDDEKLIHGAINGMFEALDDPYSDYMEKDEAEQFNSDLSSSFQGIGAEIQERNGNIVVVAPIKNSPAEKAGLLPEDVIVSVDGKSLQGMSATEAVLLIRGKKGTPVTLTIKRGNSEDLIEMTIIRDDIPIETVYGEMGDDKIAHIRITTFSENTYEELKKLLEQYEADGMKSIVLDVRQNPGGYLNAAIEISNLFVDEGKPIVKLQSREGNPEVVLSEAGKKYKYPIVVLVDNGSASASEIIAAALKESANATIVGTKTFGKGTVQTVTQLPDGSNLKYTTGKWLTPKGNWIHEKGISPDVEVPYPDYYSATYIDPKTVLQRGTVSSFVKSAELILDALGYNAGKIDETFDAATEAAVIQFQRDQGLERTGKVTGDTTYALMDALRDKIQKDDPQVQKAKELLQKQ